MHFIILPLGFLHSFLITTLTFYDAQNGLDDHAVTSALVIALVDGFTSLRVLPLAPWKSFPYFYSGCEL
jgi:hypothetical protein